jgi:biopolymer transport protein TolR
MGEMMPEHDYHIVSITSEGELWFDNQIVTFETLQEHLQTVAQEETLYIQSDTHVPYGQVVDVLTYIKEHGVQRVGLVTTPTTESSQEAVTQ